ncbi:MAG: hypothetical protein FWE62_00410 [Firmicutes bacterium]|nr:hypothetical protein [Bacillota bacterium]
MKIRRIIFLTLAIVLLSASLLLTACTSAKGEQSLTETDIQFLIDAINATNASESLEIMVKEAVRENCNEMFYSGETDFMLKIKQSDGFLIARAEGNHSAFGWDDIRDTIVYCVDWYAYWEDIDGKHMDDMYMHDICLPFAPLGVFNYFSAFKEYPSGEDYILKLVEDSIYQLSTYTQGSQKVYVINCDMTSEFSVIKGEITIYVNSGTDLIIKMIMETELHQDNVYRSGNGLVIFDYKDVTIDLPNLDDWEEE